ncbi:hypothetical protein EAT49_14605 [Histidinibacterium lentulum]|uniref:Amidohydrolase-related domain-containing protein n=1 Tax=Histidinibacterium lentulum TaxID=2480588 RepID=A0A3N2QWA3_9RHOB|nr:hypothetical protein EAT49_14605 [Histidinibacterium lentulum]
MPVASALLGPDYSASGPVEIVLEGGRIAAIRPAEGEVPRRLAMPALCDAHNHARSLSTTSFGGGLKPLETWLPSLALIPSADPYTAAAASFARSLAGGCTAVMVHLTRPTGGRPLPEEAREIARAAHDVGISIGFAVAMRDRNPLVYGDHAAVLGRMPAEPRAVAEATWLGPMMPVEGQLALVDAVAEAVADLPGHVDVQYGPNGVQWCSPALLKGIAEASASTGRRVHMHLLETKPQRDWADEAHPEGIVTMLEGIGLLSERLTLAHCVWARPEELARIAASGARVAVNGSSNLHLASGIAPVPDMLSAGISVAMGLDGCALDEDDDALREMRLLHLLHQARGFAEGDMSPAVALRAACAAGRAGLGLGPGGVLEEGMPADLLLLDLDRLDRDALMAVNPRDYLMTRAVSGHIVEVYAAGRRVVGEGRVLGVDAPALHAALREEMREGLRGKEPLIAAWPAIEAAIADHYRGCC